MSFSEPTKRFLQRINEYHQEVIDSFTPDEKHSFQKLCEDMELEELDDVTKAYKKEVAKKLSAMFSKESIQERKQKNADRRILNKYSNLNTKDIEVIGDLEKLTSNKIIDRE